jgi:hypothetical protein
MAGDIDLLVGNTVIEPRLTEWSSMNSTATVASVDFLMATEIKVSWFDADAATWKARHFKEAKAIEKKLRD